MAGNSTPAGAAHARKCRWLVHHNDPDRWFWPKVDRSGGPTACWPWLGKIDLSRRGYGRVQYKGRMLSAHRMALALSAGEPETAKMVACHRCDNPPCCNPAHLWWGTDAENDRDARAKGRKKGPHPRKIDLGLLAKSRREGRSYSELAAQFNVNQANIGRALKKLGLAGAIRPNQSAAASLRARAHQSGERE